MYQRIMNSLDVRNIENIPNSIRDRIGEITSVLANAYGNDRRTIDNGGYVLIFPTEKDVQASLNSVMEYYKLDPKVSEYRDVHREEDLDWIEELYLLTSEDSLVLIYPEVRGD